jgi:hypothetical protein
MVQMPCSSEDIVPFGVAVPATPLPQRQGHVEEGRVHRWGNGSCQATGPDGFAIRYT